MIDPRVNHELIRASAGAGKTYELTNRYLRLLQIGQQPDEILASTFTRKAAGEILGRVPLRLAQAVLDDGALAELQNALGDDSLGRDQCLTMLAGITRSLHRLRIGTLDSFFAHLAGAFALEFGLPPRWRIAEDHEDAALRTRAIDEVLDDEDPGSLSTLVHALTRGQTTRSLDREVREKVNTLYTLYRESSRDAWHCLRRLRELGEVQLAEAIQTLSQVPLPEHKGWQKNHAKDLEAAEAGEWSAFVKGGIAAKVTARNLSYHGKPIDEDVRAAYQPLIDHARAVQLNLLAKQTEATYQLLDKFHTRYRRLKSQTRALRFDDITFQLAGHTLLLPPDGIPGSSATPAPDHLAFRLDGHLHHLLLDEFQDTSLAQWSVIRPFAKRITKSESNESFFCVGDTKQAIYGWRGGVAAIFDAVTDELKDVRQRPLDTSWRSSPHVIDAVNQVFQNLGRHNNLGDLADAVTDWQEQFNEHQTAGPKKSLNGYACLQAARTARENETEPQAEITLRFAAEQVARWQQRAPGFEIGVLVRRNDAVRRLIYELRELGIEASEEGGSSLDDSAAVRLVLSLVQLADHPGDLVARYHVATSPLAEAACEETRHSPDAGLLDRETGLPAVTPFAGKRGDAAAGHLARRVRRRLLDDGYGPTLYSLARQLAPSCNRRELRRLEKLIGLAYQFDDAATSRPRDFVAFVDAAKVRDPVAADVRVMTVHQAKGLEFDMVVLADLEGRLIGQHGDLVIGRPSPTEPIDRVCRRCGRELQQLMSPTWQRLFREADDQEVTESLCVLYVATTRAVHALHMIVAPSADNERSLHKTFGGVLRAALTDGQKLEPEQFAYETGDRQWFTNPGVERERSEAEVATKAESLAPLEVKLAAPARRRWRGLERVSPSGLEGGTHVRLSDARGADRAAAMARGTLIHAWFEQIEWLDEGPPSDDRLREVAVALGDLALSQEDIGRLLAEFHDMLARPLVASVLRRDNYYPQIEAALAKSDRNVQLRVENERPIAVRDADRLLVGNIDRLITVFQNNKAIAADIIDFKTDSIPPEDAKALGAKSMFYQPQVHAYRKAVCGTMRIPEQNINARLIFVHTGKVVRI